ncbi:hypothetical protein V8D89_001377 [Ganoderma adspersum]
MTPHRALTIPDVLHEVFKYFTTHPWLTTPGAEMVTSELPPPGKKSSNDDSEASVKAKRRTLAYAARTCKAFAESASRILWEVQDGFGPIVTVLKNAQTSDDGDYTPDWVRFEHIARRVRALYTESDGGLSNGDSTLGLICARYHDIPIFPNLRALICYVPRPPCALLMRRLYASPTLLFVDTREGDSTLGESLTIVSDACPEIIHLHALLLTRLDEDGHRAVAKFNNLHTAKFGRIDNPLFRHLGTLPRLRMLYGSFVVSDPEMGTDAPFPALQELFVVDDDDDTDFLGALPYISSRSLALLSIRVRVELTEDMLEYLEEICASPPLAHLRSVELVAHITFNQWDNPDEPFEGVVFADVLRALQPLRELTAITVVVAFATSTVAGFSVEDRDLRSIAETWPDLARLEIGHIIEHDDWPGGPEGIGRPSLGAVVSLAECCRTLEAVNVEFESVDVRALEKLEARAAARSAPQTALRQIVVGPGVTDFCQKLRLADPVRMAAALRKLFPNVVGGLEIIEGGTAEGCEAVRYRGWNPSEMKTDMFYLMKALEDSHLYG